MAEPPDNRLIIHRIRAALADPSDATWGEIDALLAEKAWEDEPLFAVIRERDADSLARRVADWDRGAQPFPAPDRAVLKRALKAFRKRIKLQQLDDESRMGYSPFTEGRASSILAIQPPNQYPDEVWNELAHQGRLRTEGDGFFELAED